jgi:hypothetical protein
MKITFDNKERFVYDTISCADYVKIGLNKTLIYRPTIDSGLQKLTTRHYEALRRSSITSANVLSF